jgi:NADH-quinone oxidoreductase subunit I/electron transport complex protein RnfC
MTIEFERGKAYVVDRGTTRMRAGQGLLAGLDVVIRHFRDALVKKLDDPSQTSGVFTVQYPEERTQLPEAFRNFPVLLYEDESGQELCTSCFQCERICPPQVIHMTQAKDPATGKAVPAVAEFVIEYDACMSCGLCAEVCPFDAIKMDHDFELSTDVHGGLTVGKEQLNRPISYYEQIAPTFWAEVRDGALKKLQGNAKRRSGLIGVAPQVHERLKAEGKVPAAAPAPAAPVKPAPSAPKPAPAAAPAAAAPAAPASAEDKAARLAAIRARNEAKTAGEAAPTTDETPGALPAAPQPAEDKAARLAAIRARNAAKATDEAAAPTTDDRRPTTEAATSERAQPAAPQPTDDKAARLAAIRAKNAAKANGEAAPDVRAQQGAIAHASLSTETPAAQPAAPQPTDDKAARLAAIRAANAAKKATGETNGS